MGLNPDTKKFEGLTEVDSIKKLQEHVREQGEKLLDTHTSAMKESVSLGTVILGGYLRQYS